MDQRTRFVLKALDPSCAVVLYFDGTPGMVIPEHAQRHILEKPNSVRINAQMVLDKI